MDKRIQLLLAALTLAGQCAGYTITSNGLCVVNSTLVYAYTPCYQESANSPTSCGGLSTGSYSITNDTATYATKGYLNVNYAIPTNAVQGAWQVKHGNITSYNITIDSDCWAYGLTNKLTLRIMSYGNTSIPGNYNFTSQPQCYNGTSWNDIGSTSTKITNAYSKTGYGLEGRTYDGDWNTLSLIADSAFHPWNDASVDNSAIHAAIFEEGMWWNMSSSSGGAYNVSFLNEEDNMPFNISNTSLILQVTCPNYGNDYILLSDNVVSFSTKEQPLILSANLYGGAQRRDMIVSPASGSINFYLCNQTNNIYKLSMVDYTTICSSTNAYLNIYTGINNSVRGLVDSNYFGIEKELYVSLRNNTPYFLTLNCGSMTRSYGPLSFQPDNPNPKIEVNTLPITPIASNNYGNGSMINFFTAYDTGTVSMVYNKTQGSYDWANFTVYMRNTTTPTNLYSVKVYSTQNGVLSFVVPNVSENYYLIGWAESNGTVITNSLTVSFRNETKRLFNVGIPDPFIGISANQWYNSASIIILGSILISGTVIDGAMMGMIFTLVGVILTVVGWLTGVPNFIWAITFITSLAYGAGHKGGN